MYLYFRPYKTESGYAGKINVMVYSFQNAAFRDHVTGLYNQAYFLEVINREWHRLLREQQAMSLLLVDPHLSMEDSHQNQFLLNKIAKVLEKSANRKSDMVSRFDPMHFLLGLFKLNAHGTEVVCDRIAAMCEQLNLELEEANSPRIRLSIGALNIVPTPTIRLETLFDELHRLAKQAEAKGENSYELEQITFHSYRQ